MVAVYNTVSFISLTLITVWWYFIISFHKERSILLAQLFSFFFFNPCSCTKNSPGTSAVEPAFAARHQQYHQPLRVQTQRVAKTLTQSWQSRLPLPCSTISVSTDVAAPISVCPKRGFQSSAVEDCKVAAYIITHQKCASGVNT